ncbi:MAG: Flp family type IVb pilin [Rhodospirillales bacterium]|tara:strand:- start:5164 stop:5346 length:183 start_codon:yes stop_codon:yes gene_type:complete
MGLKTLLVRFAADQRGATALEYGLIIGVIAIAIVGGVTAVGASTAGSFEGASDALDDANS